MRVALAVTTATFLLTTVIGGTASAEGRAKHQDPFMKDPPKETVYATEHHMGFSIRSAIIRWLGGLPIVDEYDLRASEREKWWGEGVPLLPADVIKRSDR